MIASLVWKAVWIEGKGPQSIDVCLLPLIKINFGISKPAEHINVIFPCQEIKIGVTVLIPNLEPQRQLHQKDLATGH